MDLSYTNHIKRTSQVWQDIWGPDLFGTKKVKKWPQDQYFSPKVLLYPFLTQYYNRKGKKDMELSYTTHIKRTSQVWKDIWVPDIFNNNKVGKWLQDHYFSPKVLLVGTPSNKKTIIDSSLAIDKPMILPDGTIYPTIN